MKTQKRSRLAGQTAFAFGAANDPVWARKACEVVVMTPALAEVLMQGAELEGTTSASFHELVGIYAHAMAGHWWMLTGETIVVDRNGRVIDGKARLLACIRSKMPFPVVLVTGVEPEAEYGMDDRKTRSKADTLYIRGERKPQSVVHACEMIVGFLHAPSRPIFVAGHNVPGLDNHGIARLVARYPEISAAARLAETIDLPGFSHAALTAARFLMGLLDQERSDRFFEILLDPASEPKSVPARLAAKAKRKLTDGKDTKALAILAQCWEAFRTGARFHGSLLIFHGRVEGDDSALAAFPDWGLASFDRLPFEAIERPLSMPEEVANGGPKAVEEYLRRRLSEIPVTARFFDLTPESAKEFLETNGPSDQRNRKISRTHLEALKTDIVAGRWHSNGQSIKRSRKLGALMDGQHRCTAVVETGIAIEVVLVEGLNDRIFPVLDGGQRKSYAHKEKAKGNYANERAAALRVIAKIVADDEKTTVTPTLQRELAEGYPALEEAVEVAKTTQDLVPPAVGGAAYAMFALIDRAKARRFFAQIASGANLQEDDPAYALREKLLVSGRNKSPETHAKHARWLIHAWNAVAEGRPLLRIKNTKGPGFPRISKG